MTVRRQQRVIAEAGLTCPIFRQDVSEVCHKCAWFTRIEGNHPQNGDRLDEWTCAMNAQFLATMTVAMTTNQTAAAVIDVRNDAAAERRTQTRLLALGSAPMRGNSPLRISDDRQE